MYFNFIYFYNINKKSFFTRTRRSRIGTSILQNIKCPCYKNLHNHRELLHAKRSIFTHLFWQDACSFSHWEPRFSTLVPIFSHRDALTEEAADCIDHIGVLLIYFLRLWYPFLPQVLIPVTSCSRKYRVVRGNLKSFKIIPFYEAISRPRPINRGRLTEKRYGFFPVIAVYIVREDFREPSHSVVKSHVNIKMVTRTKNFLEISKHKKIVNFFFKFGFNSKNKFCYCFNTSRIHQWLSLSAFGIKSSSALRAE